MTGLVGAVPEHTVALPPLPPVLPPVPPAWPPAPVVPAWPPAPALPVEASGLALPPLLHATAARPRDTSPAMTKLLIFSISYLQISRGFCLHQGASRRNSSADQ